MRSWRRITFVILFLCGGLGPPLQAQNDENSLPPTPELLAKIPEDLRQPAKQWLRGSVESHAEWTRLDATELRYRVVLNLSDVPEAMDVVLDALPKESLRTKITLLHNMSVDRRGIWPRHPRLAGTIEQLIANDPDVKVVDAALDALAKIQLRPLKALLDKRIDADIARQGKSDVAALEERWISLERTVMLPRFLQDPPPLFNVKASKDSVRWVAFGDFGSGKESQTRTAAAIVKEHGRKPFDLGITVGDNFYNQGMESVSDPRWKSRWEDLYAVMNIRFYPSLGNHDWYGTDSPAAEILYSHRSSSWRMPATYYTFTAGPVQFFVLDTDALSDKQLAWFDAELAKSTAQWRVAYGHYPIFIAGYGDAPSGLTPSALMKPVLDILTKRRADLYIAGHHHSLQHLKPRNGVEYVISGGGGMSTSRVRPDAGNAFFASSAFGFTVFDANRRRITFRHLDWDGTELYRYSFTKGRISSVPTLCLPVLASY